MKHAGAAARPLLGYYVWQVQGKSPVVHISLKVVEELAAEVMAGFWAVPKRGAEVGGILLGRSLSAGDRIEVYIEGFEPVPCEYRNGPSYSLSEADREQFEKASAKWKAASESGLALVGFYRSHTRDDLRLGEEDLALIRDLFPAAEHVFLLVKPFATKPAAAGLFIREGQGIRAEASYLEFPFDADEIAKGGNLRFMAPAAETAPAQTTAPAALAIARIPRVSIPPPRLALLLAALAAFLIMAALQWRTIALVKSESRDLTIAGLDVERSEGGLLRVHWDRGSPAVKSAQRAVLWIVDGDTRRVVDLDARQVRTGAVAYSPVSEEVNFRLELVAGDRTLGESIRVITAGPPAKTGEPGPPSVKETKAVKKPAQPSSAPVRRARRFYDDGL